MPMVAPIGSILEEASSKHGEVDIEHHDHEQEQHRHAPT